ncbi:hypothetical protein Syun_016616 [Stephania yunnanensis]|uniref:Uncharacterized protein n=1 Tax=Stephania yunnanensis TaxID=152371 RepID=A0AAP0J5K2_9MAGN
MCTIRRVNIRSVREVNVNEEEHILEIRIVGGDHRLRVFSFHIALFNSFRILILYACGSYKFH